LRRCSLLLGMLALLATAARAGSVTMNFENADLRAVIEYIAKITGKNFLIDNRVRGKVTIVSQSPVSEEEAWRIFLSVLEVNGYAAVPSGPVIKIVPRAEGKQKTTPVRVDRPENDDALVTSVIRLKYADAQQVMAVVRPLVSPNAHLVAYARGNMLLITDAGANVRRIERIVRLLDRREAVGMRLFALRHAAAEKLAGLLSRLYGKQPGGVQAIAHQPGNVLVVVAPPQRLNEIAALISKLDRAPETDTGRLHVRYLRHAKAEEVAKTLSALISSAGKDKAGGVFAGEVKVVADAATNALLITADASDMRAIDRIIDKLDIQRRQVLIEALIVEVSGNMAEQFGIEWRAMSDFTQPKQRVFGGTNFPSQAGVSINTIAANPFSTGAGAVVGVVKGTITFGGQTFLNLGALARALETRADANVLSTPTLLTLDNEEAEILVGQNVPFVTGRASTQGGVVNPFQTIERRDIGLKLKVRPQISAGDAVRLELYQEISSIDQQAGVQGADLITNKRSIKTVVVARDGQTIVLGGLMREDHASSVQRVPCLGAIPLFGELFKFTENAHRKTNLMVFLRPHIIRSPEDIEAISEGKYEDIRRLYEAPKGGGSILFPRPKQRLPEALAPSREKPKAKPHRDAD